MKNPKNNKQQKSNVTYVNSNKLNNYKTISTYHLKDNRLSLAEKGLLTILLCLPKKWIISRRRTSDYIGTSESTFQRAIKDLQNLGYIEMKKDRQNNTEYIIKEQSIKIDFNPKYIKQYTLEQINYFLNSKDIEPRYKDLIKKAYKTAEQNEIEFTKTIKELEESEQEPTSTDNELEEIENELPF